ncbi:hypothetical protein B0T17DRAFT_517818 [Bombardia bombarda]|uniref:Uncharacterized protein n=1 Tax=Bombardia bombarda TaxID=252184 RepID=A0AA40CG12_9PEZI|nr:hypothetical protein B0T17DRAFT_517818 [Bombardia bombarda]
MNFAFMSGTPGVAGSLLGLLQSRRGLGATDPRDIIYANLGIANDREMVGQFIRVDYGKSVVEVYGDVARYILAHQRPGYGLEVLMGVAEEMPAAERAEGLRSWTPDWRFPAPYRTEMYKDKRMSRVKGMQARRVVVEEPEMVLGVLGVCVDTVGSLSMPLPVSETVDLENRMELPRIMADIAALYQKGGGVWWSGDSFGQYPHISVRGREKESKGLCRAYADGWAAFLRDTDKNGHSPQEIALVKGFISWLDQQVEKQRIFVGADSDGLMRVLYDYMHPVVPSSALDGRRLVGTSSGRFGVVPAQARKGDVVVDLLGCETPVLLRSVTVADKEKASADLSLRNALGSEFPDVGPLFTTGPEWSSEDDQSVEIGHFEVVGTCYLDGHVGWGLQEMPTKDQIKIFALH